jgi:hypothetical protein
MQGVAPGVRYDSRLQQWVTPPAPPAASADADAAGAASADAASAASASAAAAAADAAAGVTVTRAESERLRRAALQALRRQCSGSGSEAGRPAHTDNQAHHCGMNLHGRLQHESYESSRPADAVPPVGSTVDSLQPVLFAHWCRFVTAHRAVVAAAADDLTLFSEVRGREVRGRKRNRKRNRKRSRKRGRKRS